MDKTPPAFRLIKLPGDGPEDVVVDRNGFVITGVKDGRVVRVDPDRGTSETMVSTGGRPLGLEVLPDGRLLICDSPKGLLLFDPATGQLETVLSLDGAERLSFCSNVVAAPNGDIYFSVSTMRYTIHDWRMDLVENRPSGRLYRLSASGQLEKMLDGILFANGVALSPDGEQIVVAETGKCRLHRVWLTGPRQGTSEVFKELPGYPDNMSASSNGLCWVSIASGRSPALDIIHKLPLPLRKLVARLPQALLPKPARLAWVQAFDFQGGLVHDFKWENMEYAMVTSVCQFQRRVYCGSLAGNSLMYFDLPER